MTYQRDLSLKAAYNRQWRERNRARFNSWSRAYYRGYTVRGGAPPIVGNRPDNRIEAFGERKTLMEWAADKRCAVTYKLLWERLNNGCEAESAIIRPSKKGKVA